MLLLDGSPVCKQIYHSFNANSLFLLRPRDGPGRDKSKSLGVTQASVRKESWEDDDWSDYKDPSPKATSGGLLLFIINLVKKVIKLVGVMLILSTAFAATTPAILSTSRGLKTIMAMASYTIPGLYLY